MHQAKFFWGVLSLEIDLFVIENTKKSMKMVIIHGNWTIIDIWVQLRYWNFLSKYEKKCILGRFPFVLITDTTDWSLQYLIFSAEALSFKWHQNFYPLFSIGWVISNFVSQVKAKSQNMTIFALTWLTKLEITQSILKSG